MRRNFQHIFTKFLYQDDVADYASRREQILRDFVRIYNLYAKGMKVSARRGSIVKATPLAPDRLEFRTKSGFLMRIDKCDIPTFRMWLISEGVNSLELFSQTK